MAASVRFRLHAAVCAAGLLYLAGDLWAFDGPVKRWLTGFRPDSPQSITKAKASGIVARVEFHPITRSQLDRAVRERLWLQGLDESEASARERVALQRRTLDELIDDLLLRIEAHRRGIEVKASELEIDGAFQRFAARFEDGELDTALRSQGLDRAELRQRLAAWLEQEKTLELCVGDAWKIEETEAREWFTAHAAELGQPERLQARQVFLATLERNPDDAKRALDQALADLVAGKKDFAAMALELSDDEASKAKGGELGWLVRDRLPADFADAVFALPERSPALVRTTLGWHLVEVTAKQPAKPRTFEEAREEVVTALETVKRKDAIAAFRLALRERAAGRIEIWLEE
jgi:parvulin-like peptidyl-prolyl isomerase